MSDVAKKVETLMEAMPYLENIRARSSSSSTAATP